MKECFHCGLDVLPSEERIVEVLGEPRSLCCPGCEAVARAIVAGGHEDYYRYREGRSRRIDASQIPQFLRRSELYDRPEVQREFVVQEGESCEAALILEEIRCAACLWLNERQLRALPGVLAVDVDYTLQQLRVRWDPGVIRLSDILARIAAIGYVAYPYDARHRDELVRAQRHRSAERLLFAGILGMVVMNFSIAAYLLGQADTEGNLPLWVTIGRWTVLFAVSAILAYSGQDFFVGAWKDLRNGHLGMDVPIVVGLSVAWVGSALATMRNTGEVYFDSIAMFVFLVLIARYLELRGRMLAMRSLDRLARIVPATAQLIDEYGTERDVPVIDLDVGDRIRVRPGERVPIDGTIVEGESEFDESLVTGESRPVPHGKGDEVLGGSCNGHQPVIIEVSRDIARSTLSRVNRLVQRGMLSRPRYAAMAEQAATWFVAAILLTAATTAGLRWWLDPATAVEATVAVLIVTCPCALALATPLAISVAVGKFLESAVLPQHVGALESLATVDCLVLDKTGTLTLGRPTIDRIEPAPGFGAEECVRVAAALERVSEHPLARAFEDCDAGALQVQAPRTHPGGGVSGCLDGHDWRLGTLGFALGAQAEHTGRVKRIAELDRAGLIVIALSRDGALAALFALQDPPRDGVEEALSTLRDSGIGRVLILSGDRPAAVAALARRFGIDECYGGLTPEAKLAKVEDLRARGHGVVMIGDGLNDAPVLAGADASLAFSRATDLAKASCDFILLRDDFPAVVRARRLAMDTRRIILQNLLWAASYNLTAVPLAALGFVPPWLAAIGMSVSSLLVVGNSLRLRSGESRLRNPLRTRSGLAVPTHV